MPTEADYKKRVFDYGFPQILELWGQIQAGDTPNWESGKALEYLIIRAFELEGATVTYPFSVRLAGTVVEQIDGAIYSDSLSCLVECKDRDHNIAIDAVAKLRNQLLRRPAGIIGLVFSSASFTEPMLILAQYSTGQAILLWDEDDLDYALRQRKMRSGLMQKYRYCVERGLPHYSLNIGDVS